jgi:uracil-DNA glycosylase
LNEQLADGWQPVYAAWRREHGALFERLARVEAPVYPPDPLRALRLTPLDRVHVVILGQDPYHGPGQAEGLAFSVPADVKPPPSLRNILAELLRDCGIPPPGHGSLLAWAERGALLLNTVLTVEDGRPASHAGWGWERLTDALIRAATAHPAPKVFLLWGAHAQAKRALIEGHGHLVLTANHPSPLSARRPPQPFIGCGHFSQAQAWLKAQSVNWCWDLALPGAEPAVLQSRARSQEGWPSG